MKKFMKLTLQPALQPIIRIAFFASIVSTMTTLSGCQSLPKLAGIGAEPEVISRYVPDLVLGNAQVMTILPRRIPCNSAMPMQCMLAKTEDKQMIQIPFDWVEGFSPRQGITYKVSLRPYIDQKQDMPTGKWQLQSILTQN